MQCPNCQLENLPNAERCFRCDAPLHTAAAGHHAVDFMPPRAGRRKHWRWLWNPILRLVHTLPPRQVLWARLRVALLLRSRTGESLNGKAMAASVVPGLGHWLHGHHRAGTTFFVVWLILVLLWLIFMPITIANTAIGLALGVHIIAIASAGGVPRVHRHFRPRLAVALFLLGALGFVYAGPIRLVRHFCTFVRSDYAVTALDVQQDDTLRLSRAALTRHDWQSVELCLVRFPLRRRYNWSWSHVLPRGPYLGLRAAEAGDRIVADGSGISRNGALIISEEHLDAAGIGLPSQAPVAFTVPPGHCFILFPLGSLRVTPEHGAEAVEEIYTDIYVAGTSSIIGRAIEVYLPLRRRHRLPYDTADFTEEIAE